jgi:hypothetical protein
MLPECSSETVMYGVEIVLRIGAPDDIDDHWMPLESLRLVLDILQMFQTGTVGRMLCLSTCYEE